MARPRQGVVRWGVLLATVVAGLALGACGGSSDAPGGAPAGAAAPADTVAKIKAQIAKQSAYAFETVILAKDPAGKPFFGEIHEKGVVQTSPLSTKTEVSVLTDNAPMGETSQSIFVGNKAYTKTDGTWAANPDIDDQITQRDPRTSLVVLDATKDLHQTGTTTIDGTATTGFGGTFTADQFNQLPASDPAVAALKDAFVSGENAALYTVEVWVDSSFLVHRLTLTWKTSAAGAAPALDHTNTITFSKFNDPVDIKAPI